jgi:hypothetical protein
MNDKEKTDLTDTITSMVDDLPIIDRLRAAHNLVFDRGGAAGSLDQDPYLCAATKILGDVITVLGAKHPKAAKSREVAFDIRSDAEATAKLRTQSRAPRGASIAPAPSG